MDKLIAKISSGVGVKRKASRAPVLIRLSTKRGSDNFLLSDNDDSSDEDYIPEVRNPSDSKRQKVSRNDRKTFETEQKVVTSDVSVHRDAWCSFVPQEVLLKIFHIAVSDNPNRLALLLRLMRVCKNWRLVATDPLLWQSLDLSFGWVKSAEKALKNLSDRGYLQQLQHLYLGGCKKVKLECLQLLVGRHPKLKSLDIHACEKIKRDGLNLIASSIEGLRHLNISSLNERGDLSAAIGDILHRHHTTLDRIEMADSLKARLHNQIFTTIGSMSKLTWLDITAARLPDILTFYNMMNSIAGNIQVLKMSKCGPCAHSAHVTPEAVKELEQKTSFPHLVELTVAETIISLKIFLQDSPKLTFLDVSGCTPNLFQDLFAHHNKCVPCLESLSLRNVTHQTSGFTAMDLSLFAGTLKELDISWMKNFSDEVLQSILDSILTCSYGPLKVLYCSGMPLDTSHLRKLLTIYSQLETIDIQSCRQLPRGIKRLHNSKSAVATLRKNLKR